MSQPAAVASASQLARRERILDAAVALAGAGGYEAVQMRDVAERAGVALGTLYRYFPSKHTLLVGALGQVFQTLHASVHPESPRSTPADRIYRVAAEMTRYVSRNRRLSGAMIRALMSADASSAGEVEQVGALMVGFIASATQQPGSPPSEQDSQLALIIGKVWLVDVVAFLNGRMTVAQVLGDLRDTIELVTSLR